ncbi:hypothetical protein KUCAC02_014758 [Chaenocephalus aceratus]|uniref:Uncharacterized protein n=1 Tax=Chaenocephalus aceratus TaxID=36190 RepID=A0ACB9WG75_CHAAC|nr:hypothetical protein KUCAC02_014758 [Chaenocephalus aceratus]
MNAPKSSSAISSSPSTTTPTNQIYGNSILSQLTREPNMQLVVYSAIKNLCCVRSPGDFPAAEVEECCPKDSPADEQQVRRRAVAGETVPRYKPKLVFIVVQKRVSTALYTFSENNVGTLHLEQSWITPSLRKTG